MARAPPAAAPATPCTAVALKDADAVGVEPGLWEAAGVPDTLRAPLAAALALAALVVETDAAPLALPLGATVVEPEGEAVAVPERGGVWDTLCVADAEVDDDGCRVGVLLADCKECQGGRASVPTRRVSIRWELGIGQQQDSTTGNKQRPGSGTTNTTLKQNTARGFFAADNAIHSAVTASTTYQRGRGCA